jgi:hypothetical protein
MQWRCREFGTQKIQHSVDHNHNNNNNHHHHHHYHHRIEERKKTKKKKKEKKSSGFRSADHRGTTSNAIPVNIEF